MSNELVIQQAIRLKNQYQTPYYATRSTVGSCITDFDDFPYRRFWRGEAANPHPVIIEREAGYRFVERNCYTTHPVYTVEYPQHRFEGPCSTVYPSVPDKRFADHEAMNVMLNRACVWRSP